MTVDTDLAPTPETARRRLPIRGIAIGVAVVLVLGAVGGFAWWDRHPDLIPSVGGGESAPDAVGHPIVIDTEVLTARGLDGGDVRGFRVTIGSVRPNVVTNTSNASIRMELCTRNAAHIKIRSDGTRETDLYCPSYGPVGHRTVAISDAPGASMLAVVVTPHQPGIVRIAGFRVSYREGIRRQTQNGGFNVTVRSR
jgi:hypothetical protein